MSIPSDIEVLARHDETRRRFLRTRLGDAGLAAAVEMRDMQLDAIRELSEDEAQRYFNTLSQEPVSDPLLEAEIEFAQRISDLWVPTFGYSIMRASQDIGVLLERRLGRSAAVSGLFQDVERLAGVPDDGTMRVTKTFHGVTADGDIFKKSRPVYSSDHLAMKMAIDQLSIVDELIDIELDV